MFHGKSIIVTGGASGIGRAAALRFAQEGARVSVVDRDEAGAALVASMIVDAGGEAFAICADVAESGDNEHMVQATVSRFGGVDVAFLNAGFLPPLTGFDGTETEMFDRTIRVNLRGCFLGLKATLGAIRDGGAVVVTSSTAGVIGFAEAPAYAAAKHGVIGLVRSATPAFSAKGARINVICPGGVETPMMGGSNDPVIAPELLPSVQLRGMGQAQHVAEVALWLASPAAGFVNGQVHLCDAGLLSVFPEAAT